MDRMPPILFNKFLLNQNWKESPEYQAQDPTALAGTPTIAFIGCNSPLHNHPLTSQ